MRLDKALHDMVQERQRLIRRAERRYEREAFSRWSHLVIDRAQRAGRQVPLPIDLKMLKTLAEIEGAFSAAQVVRKGWCGIRSADGATKELERFVANGWLHRALPNREGQARYAFTRDHALGRDPLGDREWWPDWIEMHSCPDNRFTRGTGGKLGFNPLVAAGFIEGGSADEFAESTGEEFEGPGFDFCEVPDPAEEGNIWAVARKLAHDEGTPLHRIAVQLTGLSPIQKAYAIAIAQDRIMAEDPIRTHIRGIADYLGVDYNALRAGISAAVAAIQSLSESPVESCRGQSRDSNADN